MLPCMPLCDIIKETIRETGPVSFHDFMEMALYYPEQGYYTNPADKIGPGGDYYTTPVLSFVFGAMIAKQLEEIWQLLDCKPFTLVEYGAGTGVLAQAIINALRENESLYKNLH